MADQGKPASELIELLRRRQGSWVGWGQAFQELQKQGESSLAIFEETGFTPSQQNQMVVASQVYASLDASSADLYSEKGSDVLYELRLLPHDRRSSVAELVYHQQLEPSAVREIVKAVKAFDSLAVQPADFSSHPGDAIAYQAYKTAKETSDPQAKARLIVRALQFAHTTAARSTIESLLANHPPTPHPPRPPLYRYETEENLPRLFPVLGALPIPLERITQIPPTHPTAPFGIIHSPHPQWVAIPSYQVVKNCQDGIILQTDTDTLSTILQQTIPSGFREQSEELLLLIDRAQTDWTDDHYLAMERDGLLSLEWHPQPPTQPIHGRLILILRQKKYLDETASQELWQIDE